MTPTQSDLNLTAEGLTGVKDTRTAFMLLQYTLSVQCLHRHIDDDDAPAAVFVE